MTDIVERLRKEIERLHAEIEARKTAAEKVYLEQAAEIERLAKMSITYPAEMLPPPDDEGAVIIVGCEASYQDYAAKQAQQLIQQDKEIAELRAEIERLNGQVELLHKAKSVCADHLLKIDHLYVGLRTLLQKLKWKSIDKDNMEYSCRVPYNVMDEIRRALEPKP